MILLKIMNIFVLLLLNIAIFSSNSTNSSNTFMYNEKRLKLLMHEAKILNPHLENLINSIANLFNKEKKTVVALMGPLKTRERIMNKMMDEKGWNLLSIHDLSRGSLIFLNLKDIYLAIDYIKQIPNINITKINDKFTKSDFFKDVNMNIVFLNSTALYNDQNQTFHVTMEIQFHLCHIYHAKLVDDPIYHVRRLTKDDYSELYPNNFQIEIDKLFITSSMQKILYPKETEAFKTHYFSLIACNQMRETYCDNYWNDIMDILANISNDLYTRAWKNYEEQKKCDLESFPPENLDVLLN